MSTVYWVMGVVCLVYMILDRSVEVPKMNRTVEIKINTGIVIAETDDAYVCATLDWWPSDKCDYGSCSWATSSLLNLDLNNKILQNAVKAFAPLKIRMGGTLQDKLIYQTSWQQKIPCLPFRKDSSQLLGFTQGCLPLSRWDELNHFFNHTGAVVTFGLNALDGRVESGDLAVGDWDASNAEALIKYTFNQGYNIHGWELGNELSGNGIGGRVTAEQYAADVRTLEKLVQEIYQGSERKPIVLAPGGFFDAQWFSEFTAQATSSVQAITHHVYNLGPGVDTHLVKKILDPSYLDGEATVFRSLQKIIRNSGTNAVAWVGEAGGAYNSGQNRVTNAFVMSFWYLDQLGMASMYDTRTYCRQTLVGGNYGLLNTTTFVPNPDYYSALLWHRLMGKYVLSTTVSRSEKLRAYAHCSKRSHGVTLLLLNLDGNTTVLASISTETGSVSIESKSVTRKTKFTRAEKINGHAREEYHLTAQNGDLRSQTVLLNGKILTLSSIGEIPTLEPAIVDMSEPVKVAPFSIVFVHFPSILSPACK